MLFDLANRKQEPVTAGGVDLVLYEPSALHRAEFQKRVALNARQVRKDCGVKDGEVVEADKLWQLMAESNADLDIGITSRKEVIYLIAACLLPGRTESLDEIIQELSGQPNEVINTLSPKAMAVSGIEAGKP